MRLHHVAYATRNLEQKIAQLVGLLSFRPAGPAVIDCVQGVRIQFMDMGDGGLLELLEPHGEKSPVQRHLQKGGGLYHLCFEVDDLDATLQQVRDTSEAIVVCEPVPAPAIDNRRVAFVVTADRDLIEFLEAVPK
jgi:catechol 2,3-dioxygenase-like lactoylglutathione lyase family enzyme